MIKHMLESVQRQILCMRCSSSTSRRSISSLQGVLQNVLDSKISVEEASKQIAKMQFNQDSNDGVLRSFANLDHERSKRTGFPEAVFAEGKTPYQVAAILEEMAKRVNESHTLEDDPISNAILATRVTPDMFEVLNSMTYQHGSIQYHAAARIVTMKASSALTNANNISGSESRNRVVVATAGTTDLPVAEEAAVTLEAAGCDLDRIYDVGVAGLHRIIRALPRLRDPEVGCVIVCAGMDGALPSVVGGLVSVPVIAVPTSIGYGASFGGVSAMLTMMNSCSPGVGVVNIDNGFGAAALAYKCTRNRR